MTEDTRFIKERCPDCGEDERVEYQGEMYGKDMFKCLNCGELHDSENIIFEDIE